MSLAAPLNYANPTNWAALPTHQNNSMQTPTAKLKNRQSKAKADVFYIYPTVYEGIFSKNANVTDAIYRKNVSQLLLPLQASALNNVGKIYAPYYRQMSLWVYLRSEKTQKEAFNVAYNDVQSAFLYYLKHDNHGRPLFILSHSQGSQIAVRLLQEDYQQYHLKKILVAAYIIGERIGTNTFQLLKPCKNATQINCFVTWATVLKGGKTQLLTGDPKGDPICINPLSWKMDDIKVSSKQYLGGIPDSFNKIKIQQVNAKCNQGLLYIDPAPKGFSHDGNDYHVSDIGLFYLNLRQNAAHRLQHFRNSHT